MDRLKKLEQEEAEAQKIWEETHGNNEGAEQEAPAGEQEAQVSEEPQAVSDDQSTSEPQQEQQQESTPPPPTAESDSEQWRHKFQTLEGKYRAEVPRLNADLRQWKDNAVALNARLGELETQLEKMQSEKPIETLPEIAAVINDFPDIGKAIQKLEEKHRQELASLEKRLTKGVANEINSVKSDFQSSKEERFDMMMRQAGVPDWQALDKDPGFISYLNAKPTDYSDKTKLEFLREAAAINDIQKVARIFLEYKNRNNVAPVNTQEKLKNFVAPPKGNAGKAPLGASKPTYTREDYTRFMKETAKGRFTPSKWGGKTEEQVEAMFDSVIASGDLR